MTYLRGCQRDVLSLNIRAEFDEIFKTYYPDLVRYAMTIVHDEASSRDIVQELFVHLYEKSDSLNIRSEVKYYLISGCRNRCLNYLRSGNIRMNHSLAASQLMSNHVQSEEQLELKELKGKIYALVDKLPDRCAQIFKMNRLDGMRNAEIADKLNLSIRTVETQISKAIKFLRSNLSDELNWWIIIFFYYL